MRRIKKFVLPNPAAAAAESPMSDRIIGAAFKLFMENGYAGTSMLEIATQAKVSKRDLYANFAAKQAVLLACITNRAARMRLSPDLAAPRSREMLASTLTSFGATVVREVCQPAVMAMVGAALASTREPIFERTMREACRCSAHRARRWKRVYSTVMSPVIPAQSWSAHHIS